MAGEVKITYALLDDNQHEYLAEIDGMAITIVDSGGNGTVNNVYITRKSISCSPDEPTDPACFKESTDYTVLAQEAVSRFRSELPRMIKEAKDELKGYLWGNDVPARKTNGNVEIEDFNNDGKVELASFNSKDDIYVIIRSALSCADGGSNNSTVSDCNKSSVEEYLREFDS